MIISSTSRTIIATQTSVESRDDDEGLTKVITTNHEGATKRLISQNSPAALLLRGLLVIQTDVIEFKFASLSRTRDRTTANVARAPWEDA